MSRRQTPTETTEEVTAREASVVKAAKPARRFFDPWNSSSTGHQRAENRLAGSTSWRDSRTRKLREQFNDRSGGGGKRVADSVGAGSEAFGKDGRLENGGWARGAAGLRPEGQSSIQRSFLGPVREGNEDGSPDDQPRTKRRKLNGMNHLQSQQPFATKQDQESGPDGNKPTAKHAIPAEHKPEDPKPEDPKPEDPKPEDLNHSQPKPTTTPSRLSQRSTFTSSASTVTTDAGFSPVTSKPSSQQYRPPYPRGQLTIPSPSRKTLFRGLCFYINGSTYPEVSDHKLKQIIGQHGGSLSLGLARRTVTHVIIGELGRHGGSGGGLAASKIQKEAALGGKGEAVKYLKVGWVLESVKQMRRVPETEYLVKDLGTGGARQKNVLSMMKGL